MRIGCRRLARAGPTSQIFVPRPTSANSSWSRRWELADPGQLKKSLTLVKKVGPCKRSLHHVMSNASIVRNFTWVKETVLKSCIANMLQKLTDDLGWVNFKDLRSYSRLELNKNKFLKSAFKPFFLCSAAPEYNSSFMVMIPSSCSKNGASNTSTLLCYYALQHRTAFRLNK